MAGCFLFWQKAYAFPKVELFSHIDDMLDAMLIGDRMMDKVGVARMLESPLKIMLMRDWLHGTIYRSAPDEIAAAALNVFCWVQSIFQGSKARDNLKN